MEILEILDVPALPPTQKHPTVFKTFDSLQEGAAFILRNDHDPIPLFYEMKAERGDTFTWEKLENGPEQWKVKITKSKAIQQDVSSAISNSQEKKEEALYELNVTLLEPKLKHPTIFKHFDSLKPGEAFYILNDHDPKPLYYQLIAERGNVFSWKYEEQGPLWWKVLIKKNNADEGPTLGELAAADIRKAEVFKKYGLDFCCGGKKSLKQACEENNLDAAKIEKELQEASQTRSTGTSFDFNRWGIDFLADYIYNEHHRYWYDEEPVISDLLKKVVSHHGPTHPELEKVASLYTTLRQELNAHFMKEERVLFPHIKELVRAKATRSFVMPTGIKNINEPLQMMEADHEAAGEILVELRKVTNDYTHPEDACNSFGLLYHKLKSLEEDLHQHIHLENNILFPKALLLHKELEKMNLI
jgi:regulator of cell morphogenesis and NO signaling